MKIDLSKVMHLCIYAPPSGIPAEHFQWEPRRFQYNSQPPVTCIGVESVRWPVSEEKRFGCAAGHLLAANAALQGMKTSSQTGMSPVPVLIIEEDVALTSDYPSPIYEIPDDADAFVLGTSSYNPNGFGPNAIKPKVDILGENLVRHYDMYSDHAWLYCSARMCRFMIQNAVQALTTKLNFDVTRVLANNGNLNIYGVRKPLFYQPCDAFKDATRIEL